MTLVDVERLLHERSRRVAHLARSGGGGLRAAPSFAMANEAGGESPHGDTAPPKPRIPGHRPHNMSPTRSSGGSSHALGCPPPLARGAPSTPQVRPTTALSKLNTSVRFTQAAAQSRPAPDACWLCGAEKMSHYVADAIAAASGTRAPRPNHGWGAAQHHGRGGGGGLAGNLSVSDSAVFTPVGTPLNPTAAHAATGGGGVGPASPLERHEASKLCESCFRLSFNSLVRPVLALDPGAHRLADAVVAAQVESEEQRRRAGGAAGEMADPTGLTRHGGTAKDRELCATSSMRWSCPRCTYQNQPGEEWCAVCRCVSPRISRCALCEGLLFEAGSRAYSCCPVTQQPHEVWECDACTFMNTTVSDPDGGQCQSCGARRMWKCERCTAHNRSRARDGERVCCFCGLASAAEMSAHEMRSLGIDTGDAARERERQRAIEANSDRLLQRLRRIGVRKKPETGDGNCQFRSLASQLFGSAEFHRYVRHAVTEHIAVNAGEYSVLFGSEPEFIAYLEDMKMNGTWGDEITLRAAAEAFGVHVHVVTSSALKWHLHFVPDAPLLDSRSRSNSRPPGAAPVSRRSSVSCGSGQAAAAPAPLSPSIDTQRRLRRLLGPEVLDSCGVGELLARAQRPTADPKESAFLCPRVFLSYLEPVHYDSIHARSAVPNVGAVLADAFWRLDREVARSADQFEPVCSRRSSACPAAGDWVVVSSQISGQSSAQPQHPPPPQQPAACSAPNQRAPLAAGQPGYRHGLQPQASSPCMHATYTPQQYEQHYYTPAAGHHHSAPLPHGPVPVQAPLLSPTLGRTQAAPVAFPTTSLGRQYSHTHR